MTRVEVFDPAMCCSTGVCGPAKAPHLVRFAADLEWLAAEGVEVSRATVSQEPAKFLACTPVREALDKSGDKSLPVVLVDGGVKSLGRYPSRSELAAWTATAAAPEAAVPLMVSESPQFGCDCGTQP